MALPSEDAREERPALGSSLSVDQRIDFYESLLRAQSDLGEGVAVLDLVSKRALYVNDGLCRMLKYEDAELRSLDSFFDLVVPDERQILTRLMADRLAGHWAPDFYDVKLVCKDGTRIDVEIAATPLGLPKHPQVVVLLRDVTDRKLSEERLREFTAMIAHDLSSPMAVISGYTSFLRSRWDEITDEAKLDNLERLGRNVTNLAQLVGDFHQVSVLESGGMRYIIKPFDMRLLAERTVAERTVAELQGAVEDARIECEFAEALPDALGDEQRQWQILMNLISNAIKFSPEKKRIWVGVLQSEKTIEISVRDWGIGIDPSDVPRIFERFGRLEHGSDAAGPSGTGLGLYICKRLIEDQGGQISVESVPGEGATFIYTVPIA
ncbi:MAG: sensor histidine kinase [Actinomycetota bacterium]